MIYEGLYKDYHFKIPNILCPSIEEMSFRLGVNQDKVKRWETEGKIPSRSQDTTSHGSLWTMDEAREVYIKAKLLMGRNE